MPSEVFGFPTAAALELGTALDDMRRATGGVFGASGSLVTGALELFPLVARIQAEETVTADELQEHEAAVQEVSPFLGTGGHTILKLLNAIPPVELLGRIVFRRDSGDAQAPPRLDPAVILAGASEFIPRAEPYVELLAGFPDPRAAFVEEIGRLNEDVLTAAAARRPEFGAKEAGAAIREVTGDLVEVPGTVDGLPMLSGLLTIRQRRGRPLKLPPETVTAVTAPEILTLLDAPLPEAGRHPEIIEAVRRRPVAAARVAELMRGRELQALRAAAPRLLPGLRDLLPEEGAELRARFEEIRSFLAPAS
jgi:hypothetical protein